MATIPGTFVQIELSSNIRVNALVDVLLSPNIMTFRQIDIHHEQGEKFNENSWRFSYQHWNPDFPIQVYLNNYPDPLNSTDFTVDYEMGTITLNATYNQGDNILCSYNFDYFPIYNLEGWAIKSVDIINTGSGIPTDYDITTAPTNWDGIISDLMLAMCMERLILDYDMWKGKLIFAIGPNALVDGSDNIVSQLETIKRNAEERAYKSLDNEKLKKGEHLAAPTTFYYQALMTGTGRMSQHGVKSYGKLKGIKINKYIGRY